MDFEITPLSNGFGAEVTGLDLSQTLSYDDFETVRRAWFEAGVVVFRDQILTPEHQVAFSRRFGPLIIHVLDQFQQPGQPEILLISNKKREDGTAVGFDEAGRYWHSDLSYVEKPAFGSLLYAVEIPPEGGDTMFADMRRALKSLPDEKLLSITGRRGRHSYTRNFENNEIPNSGRPAITSNQLSRIPGSTHPMVRTLTDSKDQALYVNPGFTFAIEDMDASESEALLSELFAHCTRTELIYTHKWKPRDLLCWDNRTVMHHATPFDPTHTRHMRRTTIEGGRPV